MSDWVWHGRNSDGIPVVTGSHAKPPLAASLSIIILGGLLGIAMAAAFVVSVAHPQEFPPHYRLCYGLLCLAASSIAIGAARSLWIRRRIAGSVPVEEVCQLLDVDSRNLREITKERGIRPNCLVNGREFYALRDFGDPDKLLRPSASPDPHVLLKPATSAHGDDESLMRPANSPPHHSPE